MFWMISSILIAIVAVVLIHWLILWNFTR